MPPPSPVWDWNWNKDKTPPKLWRDATFRAQVKIDGIWHDSKPVTLKVKDANPPKKKAKQTPK